jgi:ABC-type transporter Mla maintaining outer membrane lipid asymmetry ATPase subunit MlaF
MLKPDAVYIDLPTIGQDPFHIAVDRMADLVQRYLPVE